MDSIMTRRGNTEGNSHEINLSLRGRSYSNKEPCRAVVLLGAVILSLILPATVVTGLQCYECLSLQCGSAVICESVKESIIRTFVPNSHYIHFNPQVMCPDPSVPTNSSQWDKVSLNCSRSDSLCLEAPIEVITVFDGRRDGKRLDDGSEMTSHGILRGCANRRGLKELPVRTISVKKIYMENDTWISGEIRKTGRLPTDQYKISKIYSHEIFLDHGTANATRCYMDDCNNRKKLRTRNQSPHNALPSHVLFSLILLMLPAYR